MIRYDYFSLIAAEMFVSIFLSFELFDGMITFHKVRGIYPLTIKALAYFYINHRVGLAVVVVNCCITSFSVVMAHFSSLAQ